MMILGQRVVLQAVVVPNLVHCGSGWLVGCPWY